MPPLRHGDRKRREILGAALDVSTAEGLAGVSIARLADEVGMSKSGLIAHFGTKEELQLATLEAAARGFQEEVLAPLETLDPGLTRLRGMVERWFDYVEGSRFRGGCFFAATSTEFASRPGPVRDALARLTRQWLDALERDARTAIRLGELAPDVDPAVLAFRLHAYVQEANWARGLHRDPRAFEKARAAITATLAEAAPAAARPPTRSTTARRARRV